MACFGPWGALIQPFLQHESSFGAARVWGAAAFALPLAALVVACSSSDATTVGTGPVPEGPPGMDEPSTAGPYMGALVVRSPEQNLTYTAVVPAVDDATDARLRMGLESANVRPSSYDGAIYIPGGTNPTITKYRVDGDGRFIEVGTLSFAAYGVTAVSAGPVIGANMVSPDKAYLLDEANLQLIVWNPNTMEITGDTVDLSAVLVHVEGWEAQLFSGYGFSQQRDNRLFLPVRWRNDDRFDAFRPSAGLLVIDTDTDRVVRLLEDERLVDSIYTVMADSGDLYLFSGALGVSHHWVRGTAAPGGALRVRNGEETFDPYFYIDLDQAVGNRPASTPVRADGTSVYLKVYHEEIAPITPEIEANPRALANLEAWRHWKVDLEENVPARELAELPPSSNTGLFYWIEEERRLFLGVMASDLSKQSLYEETSSGFVKAIEVTGTLSALSLLNRTR